jgi:hypothetical protein
MDYGDRQERALYLVKCCREHPDQKGTIYRDYQKRAYTASELADAIENQTDVGVNLVAMTGLISSALFDTKGKRVV